MKDKSNQLFNLCSQTCLNEEKKIVETLKELGYTGKQATFEYFCTVQDHPCCSEYSQERF